MRINRREFIKLAPLVPLSLSWLPILISESKKLEQGTEPNILILIFDTLTAQHCSLYGYPRETTPNIERAAAKGSVYHRHYAAGNFTSPGTASILTGVNPWHHRAYHQNATVKDRYAEQNLFSLFADSHHTFAYSNNPFVNILLSQFAEDIHEHIPAHELQLLTMRPTELFPGRDHTALANAEHLVFFNDVRPPSSLVLSRLLRSYHLTKEAALNEEFKEKFPNSVPNSVLSHYTLETSMDWLLSKSNQSSKPFLGYVHLFPPHFPYTPRADFAGKFNDGFAPPPKPESAFTEGRDQAFLNEQRQYYDEFIGYVDAEFGRLYDALETAGVLNNTILVLTSDHGEMFERGIWMHSNPTLYEPLLHVPLVIWQPGQVERQDIYHPTSCTDLIPTLLALTGRPSPAWLEGATIHQPNQIDPARSIFSMELSLNAKQAPIQRGTLAVVKGDYKLMYCTGYDEIDDFQELYDLSSDPGEYNNLNPIQPEIAAGLKDELMEALFEVNQG